MQWPFASLQYYIHLGRFVGLVASLSASNELGQSLCSSFLSSMTLQFLVSIFLISLFSASSFSAFSSSDYVGWIIPITFVDLQQIFTEVIIVNIYLLMSSPIPSPCINPPWVFIYLIKICWRKTDLMELIDQFMSQNQICK